MIINKHGRLVIGCCTIPYCASTQIYNSTAVQICSKMKIPQYISNASKKYNKTVTGLFSIVSGINIYHFDLI